MSQDPADLEIIRHSTAHLLAHAVKRLYPEVQVTIGPVIEDGFYYDFAFERPFTPEDIEKIEAEMHKIVAADYPISRQMLTRNEAIQFFNQLGETYKVQIIQSIPEHEVLTVYHQSEFADLCRGPHVTHTGVLKAFKLTKVSGAYWRGDSNNEMLQRIYGTAWFDQAALEQYLKRLAEAEKRDHRKIAAAMDLYHIDPAAAGMIFWHPNGQAMRQVIQQYIQTKTAENGFDQITTPQLVDLELWKKSGHWDNFHEQMFTVETENKQLAVKPMSCPCHVLVFKQGLKSYRDLPIRYAEFGNVHRNELAGAMHGLMRVRQLVQDDGHVFCTENQVQAEATRFIHLVLAVYKDFGFNEVMVKLATRPEKRIGSDVLWDDAEGALAEALKSAGLTYDLLPGEGAFYGPKIEFHLKDCLGRTWQCGTLQIDYAQPARLEAHYIAEDGSKKPPVMLHRAILGSFERFMGILIEHYAGQFPVWLAPTQAVLLNITDKQADFVQEQTDFLKKQGLRVKSDLRNEKIGFKIREHTLANVPYLLVVGDREVEAKTFSVRTRNGENKGSVSVNEWIQFIQAESAKYCRNE